LIQHGGVKEINDAAGKAYANNVHYELGLLKEKYAKEIAEYRKTNPSAPENVALKAIGKGAEVQAVYDELGYLEPKDQAGNKLPAVQYIPVPPGEPKMVEFTYSKDGKTRLNVDNDTLRAIYKATEMPAGRSEKIVKSELSTKPSEIALKKAQAEATKELGGLRKEQQATQRSIQKKNEAAAKNINKQTEVLNPLGVSEVPQVGGAAKLKKITITNKDGSKSSSYQITVNRNDIDPTVAAKAGIGIPPKPPGMNASGEEVAQYQIKKKAWDANQDIQMRFFKDDGSEDTERVIKYLGSVPEGNRRQQLLNKLLKKASDLGMSIKFVDTKGNVVSTTESIDRQTQLQNLKATGKGDSPLGVPLPGDAEPGSTQDEQ